MAQQPQNTILNANDTADFLRRYVGRRSHAVVEAGGHEVGTFPVQIDGASVEGAGEGLQEALILTFDTEGGRTLDGEPYLGALAAFPLERFRGGHLNDDYADVIALHTDDYVVTLWPVREAAGEGQ
jgi:hypothetical protein